MFDSLDMDATLSYDAVIYTFAIFFCREYRLWGRLWSPFRLRLIMSDILRARRQQTAHVAGLCAGNRRVLSISMCRAQPYIQSSCTNSRVVTAVSLFQPATVA